MHLWTPSTHSPLSSVSQRPTLLWILSIAGWDLCSSNIDAQILLLDRQFSLKGANGLHMHIQRWTHNLHTHSEISLEENINILSSKRLPPVYTVPGTFAPLFFCWWWDSHLLQLALGMWATVCQSDTPCWHKIYPLTHSYSLWSSFSLRMLRPSFTPNADTRVTRTTITSGLTQIADTKFRHFFLSSSGIGTVEHTDGERVSLCGKRGKRIFNKKEWIDYSDSVHVSVRQEYWAEIAYAPPVYFSLLPFCIHPICLTCIPFL